MPPMPKIRGGRWYRFSLRTLLLMQLSFAVLWWWTTWPSRTLREFKGLVADGRIDAAASMVVFAPNYRMTPKQVAHQLNGQRHTLSVKRTWLDVLLARQRYNVSRATLLCWVQDGSSFNHRVCKGLTVERGKIRYRWGLTGDEVHAQELRVRGRLADTGFR